MNKWYVSFSEFQTTQKMDVSFIWNLLNLLETSVNKRWNRIVCSLFHSRHHFELFINTLSKYSTYCKCYIYRWFVQSMCYLKNMIVWELCIKELERNIYNRISRIVYCANLGRTMYDEVGEFIFFKWTSLKEEWDCILQKRTLILHWYWCSFIVDSNTLL